MAEEIYGPITELYAHEPDAKVSIVLRDFEDYSNGAAYFFDNVIQLWSPALNTPFRGRHNWLRNVVTHEFTHIVQVGAAMKSTRRVPFYYFQMLTYEDVRRPDVLYGYPDGIVTYPIPVVNNPAWLAEGTAQYQRTGMTFDTWDSHRDMLLRTRVLAGEMLSLADMGGFYSHNSLERETVYNQGFAFTQYIAERYGEKALRDLTLSLGSWKSWNFQRAARTALGETGRSIYEDWKEDLSTGYAEATSKVRNDQVTGRLLHAEGFLNRHPSFSPDGDRYGYVSNRGRDFSQTGLYVVDSNGDEELVLEGDGLLEDPFTHTCALGHRVASRAFGSFSWSPDGGGVVYSRRRENAKGYFFADLYEYELESRTEKRLTTERRARFPAYAPDGKRIAFVIEEDGTANLFELITSSSEIRQITSFADGEEMGVPTWHPDGRRVFVAMSDESGQYIGELDVSTGSMTRVVADGSDVRDPMVDRHGRFLYFASDASGIFNIYRKPLVGGAINQLTNVVGGAFEPSVGADGAILFSRYEWDGYKIARLDSVVGIEDRGAFAYHPPASLTKWKGRQVEKVSSTVNMARADAAPTTDAGVSRVMSSEPVVTTTAVDDSASAYRSDFTSFSFFPVLRLDQYVSRKRRVTDVRLGDRTRGETLLRNTKLGFYLASREVLEGLSMFGGLLIGPASGDADDLGSFFAPANLLKLERDIFIQFDYNKGVLFRKKKWSPQLSLQLFNVRRNVENGLAFEELACTACFPPDTTLADLSYNLWELDVAARSKVSRSILLEAGYRFSPYRVTTERFFSTEFQQTIPATSSRYYIGRAFRLKAYVEAMAPHRHSDVVPVGLKAELTYEYEPGRLLDRFAVEDGQLVPEYERFHNHRLTADLRFGMKFQLGESAPHGAGLRVRGSTLLGSPVDDFFDDYVGGLIGARGYPFYALGGNETLWLQLSYHLPLLPRIRRQFLFLYIDKVYARIYADAAYAWSGSFPSLSDSRRDVGAELRLGLGSFYLLPTSIFVSTTYGLDEFAFVLDPDFVTPNGSSSVFYGRELQWHFGILFGFDL
jgi:Tol biopolymer transport system component